MQNEQYSTRIVYPGAERVDLLSSDERARWDSFGDLDRRLAFTLGRTAAKTLLADTLGCDATDIQLVVGESGAPEVQGHSWHVSISHAGRGGVIAAAVVSRERVGIDLERILPRHPSLWRRILAPEEYSVLEALGGVSDESQTLVWSLKEAVLKARHTGLRSGTRSVVLHDLDAGACSALARDLDGGLWRLDYDCKDGVWVTVACDAKQNGPPL